MRTRLSSATGVSPVRSSGQPSRPKPSFERIALTAIVALLAVIALQRSSPTDGAAVANAQTDRFNRGDQSGLVNPADQRQRIISELRETNKRLERVLKRIGKGAIEVKVVEMPDKPKTPGD